MDAYTQFLTLQNVRDFILYICGNNLTDNAYFHSFIHTLKHYKYIGGTCNSCRQSCIKCCNEKSGDCARGCSIWLCCPCMCFYGCVSGCLCENVKENFEVCVHDYAGMCTECCEMFCYALSNDCCCNGRCVKTKSTFIERVRDLLLHGDYREMLQNYPPYVEHCIKSWMFRVMPTCDSFGDISTYQKQLRLHTREFPIDETFDEFALYSFMLCPENQMQILSHALTYGKRCCYLCSTLDENQYIFFDIALTTRYATTFICDHVKRRFIIDNIVFARFITHHNHLNHTYSKNIHDYLLHIIPYRDFLRIYAKRIHRFMAIHENTFANFDRNNVGHHVFGNEYIVRNIHKFLQ